MVLPDRLDKEKLYIQLTNIFLSKINSGEWTVGRQIPTEEELCRGFNVSKITVRRAIDNLVVEGFLEKLQGKGTFVRQGGSKAGISMKTTLVEGVFPPDDPAGVKVIEKKVVKALDEDAIRRMGPVIDRDNFYIKRIRSEEGVPVLVNELFIPLRVCPAIKDWEPRMGPVFKFLRENSSLNILRVVQGVEVGRAGAMEKLLNVRPGAACMLVRRVFYGAGDQTVAYSRTTARGDRFSLDSEFVRLG